jgi:hypothetical protein
MKGKTKIKKKLHKVKREYIITTLVDNLERYIKTIEEEVLPDKSPFSLDMWCTLPGKDCSNYPWKNTKLKIDEYKSITIEFYEK